MIRFKLTFGFEILIDTTDIKSLASLRPKDSSGWVSAALDQGSILEYCDRRYVILEIKTGIFPGNESTDLPVMAVQYLVEEALPRPN